MSRGGILSGSVDGFCPWGTSKSASSGGVRGTDFPDIGSEFFGFAFGEPIPNVLNRVLPLPLLAKGSLVPRGVKKLADTVPVVPT